MQHFLVSALIAADCRVCRYHPLPSLGMDRPSWTDTLRASLASCIPCLTHSSVSAFDSDDYENVAITSAQDPSYAIRRARADELEGLLADSGEDGGDAGYTDRDAAGDADAISLHSYFGLSARGRRKLPPRTPRHISFCGFDLFGSGKRVKLPEEAAEPLHRPTPKRGTTRGRGAGNADGHTSRTGNANTEALLSNASPHAEALTDVSEADVERRARREARKEMRRLAAVLASDAPKTNASGVAPAPAPSPSAHAGISAVFLPPAPAPDEDDEADLDGGMYARLAPRSGTGGSRSSGSGSGVSPYSGGESAVPHSADPPAAPPFTPPVSPAKLVFEKALKALKKSKSSATSSTLASLSPPASPGFPDPPSLSPQFKLAPKGEEEFGAFTHAEEEEFDGTPGGFGFGVPEGAKDFDADADAAAGGFTEVLLLGNDVYIDDNKPFARREIYVLLKSFQDRDQHLKEMETFRDHLPGENAIQFLPDPLSDTIPSYHAAMPYEVKKWVKTRQEVVNDADSQSIEYIPDRYYVWFRNREQMEKHVAELQLFCASRDPPLPCVDIIPTTTTELGGGFGHIMTVPEDVLQWVMCRDEVINVAPDEFLELCDLPPEAEWSKGREDVPKPPQEVDDSFAELAGLEFSTVHEEPSVISAQLLA
ncbi:hypothetical protein C8R43DRAFT_1160770 [Mycena crocata]|nr:hypothetical protein C8R43DRAFT_1160770 [Mycena crocata]